MLSGLKDITYLLDLFFAFIDFCFTGFDRAVTYITYVFTPDVNIGFPIDIDPKRRHGMAFFLTPSGMPSSRPFVVDRPENLDRPSARVIESMFEQIKKLGYQPRQLEITTASELRVYRYGETKPVFVQSL